MQRKLFHPRALLVICFILVPLINAVAYTAPTLSKTPTVHNAFLEPFGNDHNFESTFSNVSHTNNSANHLLKPLKANQAQASVVTLSSLTVTGGTLSPAFSSNTLLYTESVPFGTSSVNVTPTTTDPLATLSVTVGGISYTPNGSGVFTIPLSVGANQIDMVVTGQDAVTTKQFTLTVNQASPSTNTAISNLKVNGTTLTPVGVNYSTSVPYSPGTIAIIPTLTDPNASIQVTFGGVTVNPSSGTYSIFIPVGINLITMIVTAQDGVTTKTYNLLVTRAVASSIKTLSGLTISTGTLSPTFNSGTIAYTVDVTNLSSGITVTPTAADPNASISVNGSVVASGSASANISVPLGGTTPTDINIVVTAQNLTQQTYTIAVTNHKSTISTLSSIVLNSVSQVNKTFTGATSYTDYVTNGTSTITVTPKPADASATFTATLNGSAITQSSGSYPNEPLNVGNNTFVITVTAQDGTSQTVYTLNVYRSSSSTSALLNGIAVDNGSLSPIFSQNIFSYTDIVANNISSLTVTPTWSDATTTVTVNGTTTTTGIGVPINGLALGTNTITIGVTAQDGTFSNYILTVTRLSNDATLSGLVPSIGTLTPTFSSLTTSYTLVVSNGTNGITLKPTATNGNATIKVNGTTVASGSNTNNIPLIVGDNLINTVVTAQDGTFKTYTLTVTRQSSDATLNTLVSSAGSLSPTFTSGNFIYTQTVSNATSSITVTPTVNESHASIIEKLNGNTVTTGSTVSLSVGANNIFTFLVTAQDGTTKTYTLTVTRISTDATLSSLTSSAGGINPAFISSTTSYTQTVSYATTSITVIPIANESHAAIVEKVNGTTVATSGPVTLNLGINSVTFDVTAQDGTTKQTYTLTVTRPSNDATLSSLVSTAGALTPTFTSANISYAQAVSNTTSSITVTPTINESHATVIEKLNGNTITTGSAVSLIVGSNNVITFLVTAQDGTTNTYTLTVTRASNDATLSSLVSTGGVLSPTFTSATRGYTQTVSNTTTSITVTPTVNESHATVVEKVNGVTVTTGSAATLNVGNNSITFDVTAQDGVTMLTYTLTVDRISTDATLSNLVSSAGGLSPAFTSATLGYTQTVSNAISNITVTPTVNESHATVVEKLNGVTVTTGSSLSLIVGTNSITFEVTAQDGTTKQTYTITVTRISNDASLSLLVSSAGSLTPAFTSGTINYNQTVSYATSSITVNPTVNESHAVVVEKVNGITVTTGSAASLNVGNNSITFLVTAQDGVTNQTYTLTVTRPSNDATLSSLVSTAGVLSPIFTSANTSYTQTVVNTTSTITVTPTVNESHATVIEKLNGNTVTTGSVLSLNVGNNTVTFDVTAQDGTNKLTYTIIVNRLSNDASLSALASSAGSLTPAFTPGTTVYSQTVGNLTTNITVTPTVNESHAIVVEKLNGVTVATASLLTLNVGSNSITFLVTAQDGTNNNYTLTVTRQSNDATLSSLISSAGALSPGFATNTTNYSQSVSNATGSITLTPTVTNGNATIKVNGTVVTSGATTSALPLIVGSNTIDIVVTAQDLSTKTYTLIVTRLSNDATLSNLVSNGGPLSPFFSSGQTNYTQTVTNATASINIIPTTASNNATLTVNGTTILSGNSTTIPLIVGNTTINTIVTAQDGTTRTYSIVVTRPSNDATLSNLISSAGALSPTFLSGTANYTQIVSNATNSITLTPTVTNSYASIKVNGVGVTSGGTTSALPLIVGDNNIDIIVTAQDGNTVNTYVLTVTRLSNDATLSGLVSSGGSFDQTFASGTTTYSQTVNNATNSITLTPTATNSNATIKVNGTVVASGTPTTSIALIVGSNTINTVVNAQDGTSKAYTLTVIRQSNDATLSNLISSAGALNPTFLSGTTNYTQIVSNATSSITLTPTVANSYASIKVNGIGVTSGGTTSALPLIVGNNTYNIAVTAQDLSTKTYTLIVTRPSNDATLSGLTSSGGAFDQAFAPLTTSYTQTIGSTVGSISLRPVSNDNNAIIKINGTTVSSGANTVIATGVGVNTITILVTAQDLSTKTYTLTVTRQSGDATLSNLTSSAGSLDQTFAPLTTSYTQTVLSSIGSINITPTAANSNATIMVNTITVTSGTATSINLNIGINTINILVTAQDGSAKTYTLVVTRPSNDATLTGLTSSPGGIDQTFAPSTTNYTQTVSNATNTINLTPTVSNSNATVKVNGTTVTSGATISLALGIGDNIIKIVVTAQDGIATQTYTLTVTRQSNDATLSALTTGGTISPIFNSATTSYTQTVINSIAAITVTPTVNNSYATVKVNNISVPSGTGTSVALGVGDNTINILVTAQDGSTMAYTLIVTRQSNDATLSGLVSSAGALSPTFTPATTGYTQTVVNAISSITLTPTTNNSNASIKVNGVDVTSGTGNLINLVEGDNTINIAVTAQDGTSKAYTLVISRQSNDASLSNLVSSAGGLSPAFFKTITQYTQSVPNAVSSIALTPTTTNPYTSVTINGNVATSGTATNITLNLGDNPINTTITAQDGTTQTYTLTVTRQSNIATLQSLTVTSATNTTNLLQTFNSSTNNYVLNLSNGTSSVTLTPTLTDNTMTLQSVSLNHNPINSTNKTNYNIPLAVGNNVITILLSAQDGTQNTYTLNIIRSLNTDNTLSSLGVNSGTLSPAFASGTTNYDDNVPNATSEIVLLPTANDTTASININGYAVQSGTVSTPIPLQVGANLLNVNVTAQDGTIKSYIIKVTRAQSSVATLSDLKVSNNSLDPDFDDATFLYKVNVRNSTTSVTITPTVTDPTATVTVNGVAVNSSSTSSAIPLTNIGDNLIQIEVTAQDGTIKDYTVNVRRAPSGGAILSNLTISHGTLIPGFDYGTMNYTDTVTSQNSSITITPVANETTSTIKINGILVTSGTQSPPISLALGDNTITTDVTAQDGVTKQTYSVIVTRLKSSVSTLNNLRVSAGTLSPVFNSGTTTYLDNLPNSIDVISVTADVTDATATVTVNGTLVPSGIASLPLPLNVGSNPITIVVTAQDNSTKTYTVTVNRSPSGSAILSNLVISSGSFNPLFDSETFTYNVNVTSSTTAVNITPSLNDLTSTVTVNGVVVASGSPSLAIPLITGKNVINTTVTAQDGTTKQTYTLTVSRAASSGANLSDLAVSDGTLSPLFDNSGKTISYTYNVPYTLGNITVTPTVDNPNSSVTVNGNKVTSGTASDPIPLVEGSNIIPVVVTAQNGITNQTYTINVYRALASSVASLSNLSASVGSISPVFSSGTYSYNDVVPNNTKTISITPTTTVTDEVIMINGNLVQSGTSSAAIPLAVGVNTVNVVVTSKDGNSNKTYTLNVMRSTPSSNAALQSLTINGATLNSNIDANTFSYTASLWNNDNTSKKVGFTPTAADDGATITVNGQPSTNILTTVGINAGVNAINIVVTAADGITSKTYTVLINELPTLSGITITSNLVNTNNSVSLNPFFNANTNAYTSTLSPEATAVSFVPIFSKVGVKSALINGVLYDSAGHAPPVPLIAGDNVIPVILTSADGKLTNNYTVTISRKASNVATLDSLRIDNGSLAPNFDPNIINYSVSVGNSAQGINISPKLTHPNATITINNKEETGTTVIPIPLNVGTNAIIITVTAEDGITKKTYTVIVNKDRATQTLTFNPPIFEKGVSFDLSNIIPNSKLKLSYNSLDTNIARIDTNKLLLIPKQIGKTTLVITQAGNALYYPFTLSVDITVADPGSNEILVHQFVTPNNDGFNDYLLIEGIQEFKDNTVKIINRNGINVFTIKGYDNEAIKFDGHANNNGTDYLPAGTYFYIIDYTNATGVQKHKTGYFLLRY